MAHRAAKNCNGNASKFGNGGDIETRWQKWKAQSINQNSKMAEETTNQRGSSKASQSINQKVLCSDTSNRCVAFWISYQYQYCGYHSNQWSAIQWSMTKSPIVPRCPLKGANKQQQMRSSFCVFLCCYMLYVDIISGFQSLKLWNPCWHAAQH